MFQAKEKPSTEMNWKPKHVHVYASLSFYNLNHKVHTNMWKFKRKKKKEYTSEKHYMAKVLQYYKNYPISLYTTEDLHKT